ncbi:hypothetical protein E7T06_01365 [Deinococcus sp. Arct2-2]|uniref:hypothetical protein n=1 Tax=Deinococcus sp. Arct2-2 TaxID=2568653 RepID=UPI0010A2B90B|nr:hypothetical protein [Deinococcus sp. Arct2-2]THF71632.1 hypothetical protein E7T06_01365 [Deinococcus sp. Arct2-2]
MTSPALDAAIEKGRKLIHLYRRGVGGERHNAGRLLLAHLRTHDLTLYDLDPSLPVSQEMAALDSWRETASLMTRVGTPQQDEVLTQLVDAEDLTETELRKLLDAVDLNKLAEVRADGWAYTHGADPEQYRQAARTIRAADVLAQTGSLAQRMQSATAAAHHRLTHPERQIRASSPAQQRFVLGLVRGLTGQPGQITETGVRAHLDVEQLSRLRALLSQYGAQAEEAALRAAEQLGRELGEAG